MRPTEFRQYMTWLGDNPFNQGDQSSTTTICNNHKNNNSHNNNLTTPILKSVNLKAYKTRTLKWVDQVDQRKCNL